MTHVYLAERATNWIVTLGIYSDLEAAQTECQRDATAEQAGVLTWRPMEPTFWVSERSRSEATWRVAAFQLDRGRM